jgi:hypothetical protein
LIPNLSNSIPAASRPRFSIFGVLPTAISTVSTDFVFSSPFSLKVTLISPFGKFSNYSVLVLK